MFSVRCSSIKLLTASALLAVHAQVTVAQEPASDAFVAIGVGKLAYEIRNDGERFFDTNANQLKISWGVSLTPNWDFEFSYQFTETTTKPGLPTRLKEEPVFAALPSTFTVTTTARLEIASIRALRRSRHRWGSLFAAVGASGAAIETDFEIVGVGSISTDIHTSKNGLTAGAGLEWPLASVIWRLEYEWWDADMSGITVSILRRL